MNDGHMVATFFFHYISKLLYLCGFTDGFTGIYSSQLSPQCWSADSQRVIVACPQRSRKVQYDKNKTTRLEFFSGFPHKKSQRIL